MTVKDLVVLDISDLMPSKMSSAVPYHRVTMKSTDPNDKAKYRLNLNRYMKGNEPADVYTNWYRICKPGAVIKCIMQEGKYDKCVSQTKEFKLIKEGKDSAAKPRSSSASEVITSATAADAIIDLQLERLKHAVKEAVSAIQAIEEARNYKANQTKGEK